MSVNKIMQYTLVQFFIFTGLITLAEAQDGHDLWGMGNNAHFQVGVTNSDCSKPVQVATNVSQVASSYWHSLFIKTDGTLWAMGYNEYGELGDGTTTNRPTPVKVDTNVSQVAAGDVHSLFIKTDGTLWAMGDNENGQLGDGSTFYSAVPRSTPIQVATDVSQVAAGGYHSLFVKTDGTLWAMGWNRDGQLGDGTTTSRYTPVQVKYPPPQAVTDVAQVAAGVSHSLFVKTDGTLWAMGANGYGQLGDGTKNIDRIIPIPVATNVSQVEAGDYHSLFIKTDGTLWGMGNNISGGLGDGMTTDHSTPVQATTNVLQVTAGSDHSLFIKTDGTLWAMGCNGDSQLGDSTTTDHPIPIKVSTNVFQVAAGGNHSLFLQAANPGSQDSYLSKTAVKGVVTYNGNPVTAMVLANGKYMFTGGGEGRFDLTDVPLDAKGEITVYAFCSGLAPYKTILTAGAYDFEIQMSKNEGGKQLIVIIDSISESSTKPGWYDISGSIGNESGTALVAMVLANGKYMFTNNPVGEFHLTVPLDSNDEITFYGFCSGLSPYKITGCTDDLGQL